MIDLLSPVGDFDCLKAAVQNGANSVYFGADLFSARAFASNFDTTTLEKAILYAKTRGVSDLEYQVDHLYNGIIQDFGYFPDGADLNVFSKNCGDYWEIYVVY